MSLRSFPLNKIIYITTCLAVGCTGSGSLGCGSSEGASGPTVDSDLLGIYEVAQYKRSEEGQCDQLSDVDPAPSRVVIYSAPSAENPDKAVMIGQFCDSVSDCRGRPENPPPFTNYLFLQGSDPAGWQGWGIAKAPEVVGDQCRIEIQTHTLTSPSNQAIRIDTKQVLTEHDASEPAEGSNEVTCSVDDAIADIDENSPCTLVYLLEATFETSL